jgi:SpoVK/Ycf46/Vps4 family AAA+-type ATPase
MQGDPGTGKTLFIKAICNYFKRDACIVDMRNIKTKEDFANCFSEHEKYVYVLDEFDFVQDIIRDRSMDISGTDEHKCKSTSRLQELRERQLQIMGLISNSTESLHSDKGDKKQKPPLLQELENINTEIKEVQNALSLDTILTTLDGITEMRGRIMIAATNHIDKIDPALLRDGRFDYKFHLTKFNSAEVCDMLCIMFPDEVEKIQSHSYKEDKYTPVQLISLFNAHQDLNKMIEELTVS